MVVGRSQPPTGNAILGWVGPTLHLWVGPTCNAIWVTAWIGWVKCTMVHCPESHAIWVTASHAILGHRLPCYSGSPPAMLFWVTACHAILGHRLPCYSRSLPVGKTSFVTAALLSQPMNSQLRMEFRFSSSSTYLKNESTFVCSALGDSKSVSLRLSSKRLDTQPTTLKPCKVRFTQ